MGSSKLQTAPAAAGHPDERPHGWTHDARRLLSLPMALAVFAIDSFTGIEIAIAVLYVLVLLLAADTLSRRGIILLASACAGLSLFSFLIVHGLEDGLPPLLRCAVSLAAIGITALLLLREHASRQLLVRANAALRRSEKRYRSIFEQARFSLWEQDFTRAKEALAALRAGGVTDLAAHVQANPGFARRVIGLIDTIGVNDATVELLGAASRSDMLGSIERFLPTDEPSLFPILAALWEERDHFEGKARLVTIDGRELSVLLGITFPDDGLGFDQVVVAVVDITRREQTQEAFLAAQSELARASRVATVGALSASIAHELNQPLGALVMNAQTSLRWLRRDPPDIDAAIQAAERTVRDGRRAGEIVQRTRGLLVKGERRMEPVDLRRLVEEAGLLLERELTAHDALLTTVFPAELPPVQANRVEMQQVVVNLMTNGLHAMAANRAAGGPAARELTITVDHPEPDQVRVAVRDRGVGIEDGHLGKLFVPFFTTKAEGMGMGLAICRSTIEAHGGRLSARNHEDGGAVLEFVLPTSAGAA